MLVKSILNQSQLSYRLRLGRELLVVQSDLLRGGGLFSEDEHEDEKPPT